ncbi:MAG: DNA repair protein RecO [bacterium]|jgi:DNA repair protein RecO (recombination protein O)|nr:DNA repair protein RecO [bacterium]
MIVQVEGLVVRGFRMTESSKVVILYTRDHGKVRLVAKGARRPKSKFGASLEALTWGRYVFFKRENRELQTLTDAEIIHAFGDVKKDYNRLAAGSVICELLDQMTQDEDRNPLLFRHALEALEWVGRIDMSALDLPVWAFQLRASEALGYRPHLSSCVTCGSAPEGSSLGFSTTLGGVLCPRHREQGMGVSREMITLLARLQAEATDPVDSERLPSVSRDEVSRLLRTFLNHHMASQYRPKAYAFFDKLMAAERAVPFQT